MVKTDWDSVTDIERHEKLAIKKGEKVDVEFLDDGNFVSKKILQDAKAKHPRDSHIFVLDVDGTKNEWWVSANAFSLMRDLKRLRDGNGGTLKGLKATIERVSDEPTETNYTVYSTGK